MSRGQQNEPVFSFLLLFGGTFRNTAKYLNSQEDKIFTV